MTDTAATALAELTRRRANASALVNQRRLPRAQAEAALARWCAIAAWFGAVLPAGCDPLVHIPTSAHPEHVEGTAHWLDFCPAGTAAADWRRELAQQLRRDTLAALDRYEQHGKTEQAQPLATRAHALLRLDRELSIAARLPAISAASEERKAA